MDIAGILLGVLVAIVGYLITFAFTGNDTAALIVFLLIVISLLFGGVNLGSWYRRR